VQKSIARKDCPELIRYVTPRRLARFRSFSEAPPRQAYQPDESKPKTGRFHGSILSWPCITAAHGIRLVKKKSRQVGAILLSFLRSHLVGDLSKISSNPGVVPKIPEARSASLRNISFAVSTRYDLQTKKAPYRCCVLGHSKSEALPAHIAWPAGQTK
jgi:hypothetical protein